MAKEHLEKKPKDDNVRHMLARIFLDGGQLVEGAEQLAKLSGKVRQEDGRNELAWATLFFDEPARKEDFAESFESAFQDLRKSVKPTGADDSALHTLACVHAHRNELIQARDAILRCLELRNFVPSSHDMYVFGRIAEACSAPHESISFYERALQDDLRNLVPIPRPNWPNGGSRFCAARSLTAVGMSFYHARNTVLSVSQCNSVLCAPRR